mgnify:CR=1 FL=1
MVHEAVLRPEAAAALAATLCSLSPTAAAGQQLLVEAEGMLRVSRPGFLQGAACLRRPACCVCCDASSRRVPQREAVCGGLLSWMMECLPLIPPLQQPLLNLGQAAAAAAAPAGPRGSATALAASAALPSLPPAPFASEQGLVDAVLVCLSTGSSGERQHAFAQQLIKQLAGLADVALAEAGQQAQAQQAAGGQTVRCTASPPAVQVSAWLRLALLLPLLPLVYKHRAADASGGLRGQLVRALLRLLATPAAQADAAAASGADGQAAATAAAAAAAAGEPLPQRLLQLLRALLVGGWASWMRLEGAWAGGLAQVLPCSRRASF